MLHYTWMNRPVEALTQHPAVGLGCHKNRTILIFCMVYVAQNPHAISNICFAIWQCQQEGQDVPRDPTYQLSSAITLQEIS